MARIKNITEDVLSVPSLDLTVQPGEVAEVKDAEPFKDSPLWQVTSPKKTEESS